MKLGDIRKNKQVGSADGKTKREKEMGNTRNIGWKRRWKTQVGFASWKLVENAGWKRNLVTRGERRMKIQVGYADRKQRFRTQVRNAGGIHRCQTEIGIT